MMNSPTSAKRISGAFANANLSSGALASEASTRVSIAIPQIDARHTGGIRRQMNAEWRISFLADGRAGWTAVLTTRREELLPGSGDEGGAVRDVQADMRGQRNPEFGCEHIGER